MLNLNSAARQRLYEVISSLKDPAECRDLLEDLCTIKEIDDMAQRLETAMRLNRGESYIAISRDVGVSATTISRVNRSLRYGAGGYEKALKKLEEEQHVD